MFLTRFHRLQNNTEVEAKPNNHAHLACWQSEGSDPGDNLLHTRQLDGIPFISAWAGSEILIPFTHLFLRFSFFFSRLKNSFLTTAGHTKAKSKALQMSSRSWNS